MKLTPKEAFCLKIIAMNPCSTWTACREYQKEFPRVRCHFEWADAPFRGLRNKGLVERTAQRDNGRSIHKITPLGERALAEDRV